MAEVRNHLADTWIHVGLFRFGLEDSRPKDRCVTVLVVVDPEFDARDTLPSDASATVTACRRVLDRFGFTDVAVEVAQMYAEACKTLAEQSGHRSPTNDVEHDYASDPCIGRSLGAVDSASSGTLGFYIRKDVCYYAVTCHHVIAPTGRVWKPIMIDTTMTQPIAVESPSPSDHQSWLCFLAEGLAEVTEIQAGMEELKQYQDLSPSKDAYMARLGAQMQDLGHQIEVAKTKNRSLGTVVHSSGLDRLVSGYLQDWALVRLDPERFASLGEVSNVLQEFTVRHAKIPKTAIRLGDGIKLYPTAALDATMNTDTKLVVLKVGRTTGTTKGKLNEVTSRARINYGDGIRSTETKILVALSNDHSHFASGGDSGALVVDRRGIAVGMVVASGQRINDPFPFAYVTPIAEMLEDIGYAIGDESSAAELL